DCFVREEEVERPSLKFHPVHSKSITRCSNNSRVVRSDTSVCGTVFSNRPISIEERVCLHLSSVSSEWWVVLPSGLRRRLDLPDAVRFGLTSVDPESHRGELPDFDSFPGFGIKTLLDRCVYLFFK
ncbi:hypothetical protein PENTCL1PPCAC_10493, partial [Pristionchus entomophagus]